MRDSHNPTFSGPYDHEFDAPYGIDDSLFDSYAPLASPWERLGAAILDGLFLMGSLLPGVFVLGLGAASDSDAIAAVGALLMAAGFVGLAIYQVVLLSRDGQSLGKRVLNLRIVDASDDSNPGFVRTVLMRGFLMWLLTAIPFLGTLIWLADVLMIFSEDHKTIHDRLASTVVVTERGL